MKLITVIVRTTALEAIVKALESGGLRGLTISEVKGIGEQVQLFKPYTIHSKIELFVPNDRTDEVSKIILDHASTGMTGDGLLSVQAVECVIKIRTRDKVECPL